MPADTATAAHDPQAFGSFGKPGSNDIALDELIKISGVPLSLFLCAAPAFAGVAIAMAKAAPGMAQAAAIRSDLTLTLIPSVFITAMVLYAIIIVFIIMNKKLKSAEDSLKLISVAAILGTGTFWGAVGLGDITNATIVTLAQQKKFVTSFFLLLVFTEFIGLFAFVIALAIIPSVM